MNLTTVDGRLTVTPGFRLAGREWAELVDFAPADDLLEPGDAYAARDHAAARVRWRNRRRPERTSGVDYSFHRTLASCLRCRSLVRVTSDHGEPKVVDLNRVERQRAAHWLGMVEGSGRFRGDGRGGLGTGPRPRERPRHHC